jgi:CRP-like cAMP-binding protein
MSCLKPTNDLYACVSAENRAELAQYEEASSVPAGTQLVEEKINPDRVTILNSGTAEIYIRVNGQKVSLGVVGAGHVFGLHSILAAEETHLSVTCLQNCHITTLPRDAFKRVLHHHPEMYFAVAKVLGADLDRADRLLRRNAQFGKTGRARRAEPQ